MLRILLPTIVLVATLTISPSAATTVSGKVADTESLPVEGASITFTNEADASKSYSALTDADGMYRVLLDLVTDVDEVSELGIPETFQLLQNYPNPFNASTVIPYQLAETTHVRLAVYNTLGQPIHTLVDQLQPAGLHTVQWDGRTDQGRGVGAGVYIIWMETAQFTQSRKAVLVDGTVGREVVPRGRPSPKPTVPAQDRRDLYTVTITGDNIEPFTEAGISIRADTVLEFEVVRIQLLVVGGREVRISSQEDLDALSLTATDSKGATGTSTVTVTVCLYHGCVLDRLLIESV